MSPGIKRRPMRVLVAVLAIAVLSVGAVAAQTGATAGPTHINAQTGDAPPPPPPPPGDPPGTNPPAPPSSNPFTDIGSSAFHFDILWIYDQGISRGCTTTRFCPTNSITRGQMAAFLNRALGLSSTSHDFFTDDETSIFEGDINRLAAAGITGGCAAGRFCPNGLVSRGQMAAFLARAFHLPAATVDYFSDDNSSIFEGDINALRRSGLPAAARQLGTVRQRPSAESRWRRSYTVR